MSRVLFSPVGSRDPYDEDGEDGALIHIVRHYRPGVVVLYLSEEMADKEAIDARYSRAVNELDAGIEVRIIPCTVADVHRYDGFIPEFRRLLLGLAGEFPRAELLLNTTSGTPAMQAGLVALNAFGIPPTQAVQVAHWLYAGDGNRCLPVTSAALGVLLQRQNLKQLVHAYDYPAALALSSQASIPAEATRLIEGAAARLYGDHDKGVKCFGGTEFRYDPAKRLSEAVSCLPVYIARGQWSDFIRATTPIVDVLVNQYGGTRSDEERLAFPVRFERMPTPKQVDLQWARKLHSQVRNPVTHTLRSFTADAIKRQGGIAPSDICEKLRIETGADLTLYDRINTAILNEVDSAPLHL
jgi:hypothetical protein